MESRSPPLHASQKLRTSSRGVSLMGETLLAAPARLFLGRRSALLGCSLLLGWRLLLPGGHRLPLLRWRSALLGCCLVLDRLASHRLLLGGRSLLLGRGGFLLGRGGLLLCGRPLRGCLLGCERGRLGHAEPQPEGEVEVFF